MGKLIFLTGYSDDKLCTAIDADAIMAIEEIVDDRGDRFSRVFVLDADVRLYVRETAAQIHLKREAALLVARPYAIHFGSGEYEEGFEEGCEEGCEENCEDLCEDDCDRELPGTAVAGDIEHRSL